MKENETMKTTKKIKFETFDKVNQFVRFITDFESDLDVVSGRYVVNAKSIMGIYSLDLSKVLDLNIYENIEGETEKIVQKLKELNIITE